MNRNVQGNSNVSPFVVIREIDIRQVNAFTINLNPPISFQEIVKVSPSYLVDVLIDGY